jgi:hypothetical protein
MPGLLTALTTVAGFILGVRVGFALARREDNKRRALLAKKKRA